MIRWLSAPLACAALAAGARAQAPDYVLIVEQVGPSIVHVLAERPAPPRTERGAKGQEDAAQFLERFAPPPRPRPTRGSGFILTQDGYVVTSASNVEGDEGTSIKVTLTDGREFPAKRAGADPQTDIALLKIEARGLRPVKFGDASKLRIGQRLLLVGSAFAGENTIADGIISQLPRRSGAMPSGLPVMPYVATTVPVQPGNGGAPFVDSRGEVVGFVTQMYVPPNNPFATISFGVPPDMIRSVADSLRTVGYVPRGSIRVTIQEVSKELADTLGMPAPRGALVNEVQRGGAADRAGIQRGDIILQFNGKAVDHSSELPWIINGTRPGTRAPVQVFRKAALVNLEVEVEELPRKPPAR